VDPSGRFAYVANWNSNNISAYAIDASTGALTSIGPAVAAGNSPRSVSIDPSGKFAYAPDASSNDVSVYSIDSSTGALSPLGKMAGRKAPTSIAVTPGITPVKYTPQFAYAANYTSNNVSAYTIDPTGALSSIGAAAAGVNPNFITVDPTGRFAYTANNIGSLSVFTINAATGALTRVNNTDVSAGVYGRPESITVDPSGRFAYVANYGTGAPGMSGVSAFSINAATGWLTSLGALVAAGSNPISITVDPTGRFAYVANSNSNDVSMYSIDPTGVPSSIGTVAAGNGPYSVAVDPTGRFVYVANYSSNDVSAYTINSGTGALTSLGSTVAAGTAPGSLAVDPTGRFAYAANMGSKNVSIYTIDPGTGALTAAGTTPAGIYGYRTVSVDPSGKYAYVVDAYYVYTYAIDASTGALTRVGTGPGVTAGTTPMAVGISGTIQ
jgi:6-phosphogluconolactonase (cycloisomerase 2 family)